MPSDKEAFTQHISQQFNDELEEIRTHLLEMGGLVEKQINDAIVALVEGDARLAQQVREKDDAINQMELDIDQDCLRILARRQPAASDLRLVVSISKIIVDLERMVQEALDAFARMDTEQAFAVAREDKAVDQEYKTAMREMVTFMMEDPRSIGRVLNILWVLRSLERVGDHARNIAEHVIYLVKGTDVRHIGLKRMEAEVKKDGADE